MDKNTSLVQVVPAVPSCVPVPSAVVKMKDTTKTSPQTLRLVQVVSAAPAFVLVPSASVKTEDTPKTSPETVRPTRLQDPGDTDQLYSTVDTGDTDLYSTVDGTQNSITLKLPHSSVPLACSGCVKPSQYPALQDCLPTGYDYHVVSFEERTTEMDHSAFCATLRLPLKTAEETQKWIMETRDTPACITWRIMNLRAAAGKRIVYRRDYICQHNSKNKVGPTGKTKNINCPAKLSVIIKADAKKSAKVDVHMPQHPTVVIIQNVHNHNLHSANALKHRDVGREATEKLMELMEQGHTGASALKAFRNQLRDKLGDNYVHAAADRGLCPDLYYCQHLYNKIYGKRSDQPRKPAPSLPKGQKNKEKQIDYSTQGQSSQLNPSQADLRTKQEEREAARAADFISLSNDCEDDREEEDLVDTMIRDINSLRKDPAYSQALAAMARHFHCVKSNPSRLLALFREGQTSPRRTATTRADALSPRQPTLAPRSAAKPSSKRHLPSLPQQTHSSPIKQLRLENLL